GFLVGIPTASEGLSPYAKQRDPRVEVSVVVPGSPAEAAGIALGDRVTTIGQTVISSADEALAALRAESARQEVFSVSVLRDGQTQTVSVMPAFIESIQRPGIGIGLEGVVTARLPVWLAPIEGARTTFRTMGAIYAGLGSLVTRLFQGESVGGEVSGPIGIAVMTGKVAENGVWALARFAALLSLNLAVVNSLPIPALDGGRLLFIIIERLRGPRHRPETEALIHTIGFFLLIGLILAITLHDVRQYGGGIWRRFTALITEQGV
ncbi:MAG: regulator of sigma protease, partial [Patescibacteria group bacterium]|nr:regulator of sigma protease [Patescibacteria group bacterium]